MRDAIVVRNVSKRFMLRKDRADSVGQLLFRMLPNFRSDRRGSRTPFWALRNINFSIPQGSSLGIVGDNGSGKSTLLKLLTQTMLPTEGSIEINGSVSALIELGAGFHPDFTGRENIYLNASILGYTRRQIAGRINSIVDFAELWDFIDTPVKYYSSGMSARLGFSIATAVSPDILIIDEILAVGDEAFQAKCMEKIRAMKHNGTTILYVSHSLSTVISLADTVLWLDKGTQAALGDPEAVVRLYRIKTQQTHSDSMSAMAE